MNVAVYGAGETDCFGWTRRVIAVDNPKTDLRQLRRSLHENRYRAVKDWEGRFLGPSRIALLAHSITNDCTSFATIPPMLMRKL